VLVLISEVKVYQNFSVLNLFMMSGKFQKVSGSGINAGYDER